MESNFVFDNRLLSKLYAKTTFTIGIDTATKDIFSYCLIMKCNKKTNILLAKTMNNKKEFDEEVNNLSKYFNAKIIEEL